MIHHYTVDATGHGTEYRQNPKDRRIVERRISTNRWQTVQVCATPTDARALLFQLDPRAKERKEA